MSKVAFGKRRRLQFTAGGNLKQWQPSSGAAIYAVTYKPDAVNKPKSHCVVYFGESPDLLLQSKSISEDLRGWWAENSISDGELFIFSHAMPGSSQYERASIQNQLIKEYEPKGNN